MFLVILGCYGILNTFFEKPPNKSAEKICNQYSQRKDAIKKKNL